MSSSSVLKSQVYEQIRRRVLTGMLRPGGRVSELSLAKELGVSRTPVREAIGQLVHEGLIEYIPNEGNFLKKPSRRDIREVFELRECLERFTARLAAEHATPEHIAELKRACAITRAMADALRGGTSEAPADRMFNHTVHGDMAFHMTLIRASQNRRALSIIGNNHLLSQVWGYLQDNGYSPDVHKLSWVYREHMRVVRYVERRDPAGAEAAMADHVRKGCEHVLGWFDRVEDENNIEIVGYDSWAKAIEQYDREFERQL